MPNRRRTLVSLCLAAATAITAGCVRHTPGVRSGPVVAQAPYATPGSPTVPLAPGATAPMGGPTGPAMPGPSHSAPAPVPAPSAPPTSPPPPPPAPRHPYHQPLPPFTADAPAMRLANLSPRECREELQRRALPVVPHKTNTAGIAYALRISGPMHGVRFVTAPAPSRFGLLDCRLALAMDELAKVIAPLQVSEVHVGSMYRRGARIAGRKRRRSQHSYGLAMDISSIRLQDGRLLRIEPDFHATIGDTICGPAAVMTEPDDKSIALRNIVCAVARSAIFHHMITPGGDYAHRNHLHFDIKRDAKYRRVR